MARMAQWTAAAVVLLGLTFLTTAQAQPPEGGRGRGPQGDRGMMRRGGPGGGMGVLLRLEAVQKELNLSDEQINQLEALATRPRGPNARGRGRQGRSQGGRGPERKSARGNQNRPQGQLENVLQPQQLERLRQIELQMRLRMEGVDAFSDPRIAKALAITNEQRKQFRQLRQELLKKGRTDRPQRGAKEWRDLSQEDRMAKMAEMREKFETLRKEASERALAVLTSEQREKLQELTGKELKLDPREMRPPMRGGPGPGGRGQGGPRGEGGRRGPQPDQE